MQVKDTKLRVESFMGFPNITCFKGKGAIFVRIITYGKRHFPYYDLDNFEVYFN